MSTGHGYRSRSQQCHISTHLYLECMDVFWWNLSHQNYSLPDPQDTDDIFKIMVWKVTVRHFFKHISSRAIPVNSFPLKAIWSSCYFSAENLQGQKDNSISRLDPTTCWHNSHRLLCLWFCVHMLTYFSWFGNIYASVMSVFAALITLLHSYRKPSDVLLLTCFTG